MKKLSPSLLAKQVVDARKAKKLSQQQLSDLTGKIKDSFRKRRLSGIHMRQDPDTGLHPIHRAA